MSAILSSLFEPGLNAPMHNLMNACFAALLLVLLGLALLTRGDLHVLALAGVAGGLWGSVNWFLAELAKLPPPPASDPAAGSQETEGGAADGTAGGAAGEEKEEKKDR